MPEDKDVCVRHLREGCEFFKSMVQRRSDLEADSRRCTEWFATERAAEGLLAGQRFNSCGQFAEFKVAIQPPIRGPDAMNLPPAIL